VASASDHSDLEQASRLLSKKLGDAMEASVRRLIPEPENVSFTHAVDRNLCLPLIGCSILAVSLGQSSSICSR